MMRLGQYRDPVPQSVVRHGAKLAFIASLDQRLINLRRQFRHESLVGGALGMIDDELQHASRRYRQLNLTAIANPIPGRPVAQSAAVAGQSVAGFAFAQQILDGALCHVAELSRLQGSDFSKNGQADRKSKVGFGILTYITCMMCYAIL